MTGNNGSGRREPHNVQADLRNDGGVLMIVVDLNKEPVASGTGKSKLYGSTGFPVRIEHPEIPGLWYSVTVGCDSEEYGQLKQEQRALRERMKAFKAKQVVA